ncbi:MAG: TIGR04283 family arsenosugar biosynthesis glycosyltransferase [Rhodobacteraceae bacterium]|nr:TIGR04283 family arsenosugar biosynthesis glycosyltransferase [Paracoccaceae bacterium]
MRAPLSVVMPVLNGETVLGPCLAALYEGVQAGLIRELIVVDGGSEDRSVEIAQEAGAQVLELDAPSRGGQLRSGCAAAQGAWLLVLHADTILEEGWSEAVAAHLSKPYAGYFRLGFDDTGGAARWVAGWANLRARVFGLPYGDQGLLIERRLYEQVGGYADIPLMEDVAIARALGRRRLGALDALAVTSAEKYRQQGWFRRGARNLWTLLRYFVGITPERLAKDYRR